MRPFFLSLLTLSLMLPSASLAAEDAIYRAVYGPTEMADATEACFYVRVEADADVQTALDELATALSRFMFDGLVLSVRIEEEFDDQIAVVSLEEEDAWRDAYAQFEEALVAGEDPEIPSVPGIPSWRQDYFQGSTGGQLTSMTLRRTFMQEAVDEPWVDAVRFEYEGLPIGDEWDHLALSDTYERRPR